MQFFYLYFEYNLCIKKKKQTNFKDKLEIYWSLFLFRKSQKEKSIQI